jgi:hypothetical protein
MDLTLKTESYAVDDQSWLASRHGVGEAQSVTLDVSAFTANTHYPDGFFKSGLPLARLTATGKYVPYATGGAGGAATLAGFLFGAVKAPAVNTTDVVGAMLDHCKVVASKLPVAVDATGQATAAGRIIFY